MATKDFDYENFAQNLAAQAQEIVPQDFTDVQKQYVINTLGNFALLSGKALAEDPNLNFNADQAVTITQIIAEWSFHKSVDIIRSGIPQQYWDSVIAELKNKGVIDEELMEFAASQSNMDRMAQEMQQQNIQDPQAAQVQMNNEGVPAVQSGSGAEPYEFPKVDSKVLKLATVAMLFKKMNQDRVQTILNKFDPEDAQAVIKYMRVPDLAQRIGTANALRCLQEIKTNLPKATDIAPNRVVMKLRHFASKYSSKDLDTILIRERMGVKRLVFNAIEGKYYDKMPPKVASIVASHLANGV